MTLIPPGSTIGILGGGQLGRMLAMAAARLGYRCHIFAPEADSVAAEVSADFTCAAYDDVDALDRFAAVINVATFEFENVPVAAVERLARVVPVRPGAEALRVAQDRTIEKQFAVTQGLTPPAFASVTDDASLSAAVASVGVPAILKTAREGYDGKGQARIASADQAAAAWDALGRQPAILERMIAFDGEFSVLVARGADGALRHWDAPQNRHDSGILARSSVPAPAVWAPQIATATAQVERIAAALDYVGVLAAEFFACADGPLFNEMAPRVHNSGHWTSEGAVTSQFENHIRAVCGLPLGDPATIAAPVVMDNLIGAAADNWAALLADPACHLHLYGKGEARAGRKMGHATWVGCEPA